MKNYVIGVLLVGILVLGSIIYKKNKEPILQRFPIDKIIKKDKSGSHKFYLYIFFSKRNCYDCLRVIDVLNELPSYFIVRGIVPKKEFENEKELREITGAKFPIYPVEEKHMRFLPLYSPTVYGVDGDGIIYFILPGVPREKEYIKRFFMSFYYKAYNLFDDCGGKCGK